MNINFLHSSYKLNPLETIMLCLIFYIGVCVIHFSSRYMKGDAQYNSFFLRIILLISSIAIMVTCDNLWYLLISLLISNLILVRLIIHKSQWKAAKASGFIIGKNYLSSALLISVAFSLFYLATGASKISAITNQTHNNYIINIGLSLLLIAAMKQSAIWPFHKWLISSLNSPTPVSAIMHAGIINAGGFLLVRFAPLYSQNPIFMNAIFIVGIISGLIGTLWKLMQNDVKRMLACSTMGQMGFMFAQIGLGLYPLAIAHLCWHGMFKAYLFLRSSSAAQETPVNNYYQLKPLSFTCALIHGVIGSFIFGYITNKSWLNADSTIVILVIALIAGSQLSLTILRDFNFKNIILAALITIITSIVYGKSTQLIMWILKPIELMQAQPLNFFHIFSIFILTFSWFWMLFFPNQLKNINQHSHWLLKAYVKIFNYSQPHQTTITAYRNYYQY